ncbi:hypothetical protein GB883_06520 [Georgenia thermotolerans]|uniref:Cardiolipin synthase N-terminal domain-containing protein n=1 Tax=Georgenia thermotolerans TaxID=527326 RepID=A0A7J5US28_9MICO|nr:hypothetical protein GB883_06520 [Georgenia thermotolerans]
MTWAELSGGQRAALVALGAVEVALAAAAWTDLARRPADAVNGRKSLWAAAIAVNIVGPLSYFKWGRRTAQ